LAVLLENQRSSRSGRLLVETEEASSCWFDVFLIILLPFLCVQSGKKKVRVEKEENVTLGPTVREGEHVFGVAHIFASFNDTFVVSLTSRLVLVDIYSCFLSGGSGRNVLLRCCTKSKTYPVWIRSYYALLVI